ncbi:nucleolar protein 8-like isoform X2 [Branchiostoma lanceolatum]|uniref:nucleolar protein 8-like isoform X2 n=1 Tax=Branchiostoma lanceolatum TaxID=7740 RepID=UPI00345643D3
MASTSNMCENIPAMVKDPEQVNTRLYVGGLFCEVTDTDLMGRFEKFGAVSSVDIVRRRDDKGKPGRTFAFINLTTTDQKLKKCMAVYNKSKWKGHDMQIQVAKESFLARLAKERQATKAELITEDELSVRQASEVPEPSHGRHRTVQGAAPGTAVEGEKNWVVGKYGRILPVVYIRRKDKKKVMKVDPSKYSHNLKRVKEECSIDTPINQLTWSIQVQGSEDSRKKQQGDFSDFLKGRWKRSAATLHKKNKKMKMDSEESLSNSDDSDPNITSNTDIVQSVEGKVEWGYFKEREENQVVQDGDKTSAVGNSPSSVAESDNDSGSEKCKEFSKTSLVDVSHADYNSDFEVVRLEQHGQGMTGLLDGNMLLGFKTSVNSTQGEVKGGNDSDGSVDTDELITATKHHLVQRMNVENTSDSETSLHTAEIAISARQKLQGTITTKDVSKNNSPRQDSTDDVSESEASDDAEVIAAARAKLQAIMSPSQTLKTGKQGEKDEGLNTPQPATTEPDKPTSKVHISKDGQDSLLRQGVCKEDLSHTGTVDKVTEQPMEKTANAAFQASDNEGASVVGDDDGDGGDDDDDDDDDDGDNTDTEEEDVEDDHFNGDDDGDGDEEDNYDDDDDDNELEDDDDSDSNGESLENESGNESSFEDSSDPEVGGYEVKMLVSTKPNKSPEGTNPTGDHDPTEESEGPVDQEQWKSGAVGGGGTLANEQRLQSLRQRQLQAQSKQALIKKALSSMASTAAGKHIVFDSEDEDSNDGVDVREEVWSSTLQPVDKTEEKKLQMGLFETDGEEDSDSGSDDSDDQRFQIKPQFQGKTGEKLLQLQAQIGQDDRFRMDHRFLEDSSDGEEDDLRKTPTCTEGTGVDGEMEAERQKSLEILRRVVGTKAAMATEKGKNIDKLKFKDPSAVRYDPTREDHKQFEIPESESQNDAEQSGAGTCKEPKTAPQDETVPDTTKDRYFQVTSDLKEAFSSADGQTFSFFGPSSAETTEDIEEDMTSESTQTPHKKSPWQPKVFQYDSSDEEDEIIQEDLKKIPEKVEESYRRNSFFFTNNDSRLKGMLQFYRKDKLEDIRQAWEEVRPELLEETKKRHKNAVRQKKKNQKNRPRHRYK